MGLRVSSTFRLLPVIPLFIFACSEDDKINEPPVAVIEYGDGIDRIFLYGNSSTDKEKKTLTYEWSTSNQDIVIQGKHYAQAYFKIPAGLTETSVDVSLKVGDSKNITETILSVPVPALTEIRSFGLGANVSDEEDNTAPYPWYMDQGNSGIYAGVNCGPASVTMAAKWANVNFNNSIEDARNTYRPGGGWWYTDDIINYLNLKQVTNWTIPLTSTQVLKEQIDNDHIIILCLDMFYVRAAIEPEHRVDKFYLTQGSGWGHFIVLKGYKEVDGKLLFEAYDPYSLGNMYQNQTLKGLNRYYVSTDLDMATQIWWDFAIVVSKGSSSGKHAAVDVTKIIHKPGR